MSTMESNDVLTKKPTIVCPPMPKLLRKGFDYENATQEQRDERFYIMLTLGGFEWEDVLKARRLTDKEEEGERMLMTLKKYRIVNTIPALPTRLQNIDVPKRSATTKQRKWK